MKTRILETIGIMCLLIGFTSTTLRADLITVSQIAPADFTTIQEAINNAWHGDVIEVDTGTYYEHINLGGLQITLRSKDPTNGNTVLQTVIDGSDSGTVITCSNNETSETVISGFLIQHGQASVGAGLYCSYSNPTIRHCVFSINTAEIDGGGLYCQNSNPTVEDCMFFSNYTDTGAGGGIYCDSSTQPVITRCTFSCNYAATEGGGLYCAFQSVPQITDCFFSLNSAYDYGGGVSCGINSEPEITRCTFDDNDVESDGAGLYGYLSYPVLDNCTFSHNEAQYNGGGIYFNACSPEVRNCTFHSNIAQFEGGGLYIYSNTANITNCTIRNNSAFSINGGGIYNGSANVVLTDTVVCGNSPNQIYSFYNDNGGNVINDSNCPPLKLNIPGDLNGDGNVNMEDLALLASNWLL